MALNEPAFFRQLLLLVQKNALLRWSAKARSFLEFGVPLFFVGMLLAVYELILSDSNSYGFGQQNAFGSLQGFSKPLWVGVRDGSNISITEVLGIVSLAASAQSFSGPIKAASPDDIVTTCQLDGYTDSCFGGVIFNEAGPTKWNYTIRMSQQDLPSTASQSADQFNVDDAKMQPYINSGFVALQTALDQAIITSRQSPQTNPPTGTTPPNFPSAAIAFTSLTRDQVYQQRRTSAYEGFLAYGGAPMILFAFITMVYCLMSDLMMEKESRLLEGMKMMGLTDLAYYGSWVLTSVIFFVPPILIVVAILKVTIQGYSSFDIIFFLYLSFGCSLIALCFVISVVPVRAAIAGGFGAAVVLALLAVGVALISIDKRQMVSGGLQGFSSLLSPVSFTWAQNVIFRLEEAKIGVTSYSSSYSDTSGYSTPAISLFVAMMWVDTFLYAILAWYLSNVFPGEYGTPLPWNFPVMPEFWLGDKYKGDDPHITNRSSLIQSEHAENVVVEEEHLDLPVAISVERLRKEFFAALGNRLAVKDLNLSAYKNEVLALLGHNGAARKTTLISMLTGLIRPTSGDAHILGHSIRSDMRKVRQSIGVCPQHDVLWPDLTVRQTLNLFAGLKGVSIISIGEEVVSLLDQLGLTAKADVAAGSLSGGQKRRLSLAIALIGGSQVVFLDEVTSGVDPLARRAIWDVINKNRTQGRCIILCTHFLDEADVLGDRVAVMSKGQLRASGSPVFLKSRFGIGYTLTVVTKEGHGGEHAPVIRVVTGVIPTSRIVSTTAVEVVLQLPLTSAREFPNLFRTMEADREALGIRGYGVSMTTLEDVFLRIAGENAIKEEDAQLEPNRDLGVSLEERQRLSRQLSQNPPIAVDHPKIEKKPSRDPSIFQTQFKALWLKRYWAFKREPWTIVILFCVSIGLVILSAFIGRDANPATCSLSPVTLPPLELSYTNLFSGDYHTIPVSPNGTVISQFFGQPSNISIVNVASAADMETTILANRMGYAGGVESCCEPQQHQSTIVWQANLAHTLPTMVNLVDSVIFRRLLGSDVPTISTSAHPFPEQSPLNPAALQTLQSVLYFCFLAVLAFAIPPAQAAMFVVRERELNVKHQQIISGANLVTFYLSHLAWDAFLQTLYMCVALLMLGIFEGTRASFWGGENAGPLFIVMIFFNLASTMFAYAVSLCFSFSKPGMAFGAVLGIQFGFGFLYLLGVTNVLVQYVLGNIPLIALTIVNIVFICLSPMNGLIWSFIALGNVGSLRCKLDPSGGAPVQMGLLGLPLLVLPIQALFMLGVLIYFEKRSSMASLTKGTWSPADDEGGGDEEVVKEERHVAHGERDGNLIVLKNIRKEYPPSTNGRVKVAVKNLSMSVPAGHCFGLLGPNGAGKTSALKILCGEERPTYGTAILASHDINEDLDGVRKHIGFCPQFDALLPTLTTREHLWLYGRLRGIPDRELGASIMDLMKRLNIEDYADKMSGTLSGGNKRRLSLAIALLGNPPVLFIDEATTGCDPVARRFMLDVITAVKPGRAIIFTTHSMEDADAVCDTIGILVDGRLKCFGSPQLLKASYGQGYQLDIKANLAQIPTIEAFVQERFPSAKALEKRGTLLQYEIPGLDLPGIFEAVETTRDSLGIRDYSVSQTTLEQIFLHFAHQQLAVQGLDDYGDSTGGSPFDITWSSRVTVLNILHCLCGGAFNGLFIGVIGLQLCMGIITFPFGKMCLRLAAVTFFPYGRNLQAQGPPKPENPNAKWVILIFNLLWCPLGLAFAIFHILMGCLLMLSLVGIPLGLKHFELVKLTIFPFGLQYPHHLCCGRVDTEEGQHPTLFQHIL